MHVRRSQIFEDSFHQLQSQSVEDLKSRLSIKFYKEEGVDAGGVAREWFLVLSRAIFNPDYALFRAAADNGAVFQPNRFSYWNPDHLGYFTFVGRFVGKAIYDGQRLDAYFTRSFYKHILGIKPSFSDLESIDPGYHKNLKWMLENNIEDVLDLTFHTTHDEFGETRMIDLKPNGRNIAVTEENKEEYVNLIAAYILTDAIKKQLEAFLKGFRELIPVDLVSVFTEQELELLISGLPDIDIDDLKQNTEYRSWVPSDQTIQWFWKVVYEFNQQQKALLLLFITGTSRLPIEGFSHLRGMDGLQRVQIAKGSGTDRLPSAHTCFNQIDLPTYSSMEMLKQNLLTAITEGSEGFGFS